MTGSESEGHEESAIPERLIQAALKCFLNDDYHNVTTRKIADVADVSAAMIRYYFGSKEGLYEEMIRQTLLPLINALDQPADETALNFSSFLKLYYDTITANPKFPMLILKIMALNKGPGKNVIRQLLERGRNNGNKKISNMVGGQSLRSDIDPDVVRISFVSLAMMPMLSKSIFEEQIGKEMDAEFLDKLSTFNGEMLMNALLTDK